MIVLRPEYRPGTESSVAKHRLGERYLDDKGFEWVYCKAKEAFSGGQALTLAPLQTDADVATNSSAMKYNGKNYPAKQVITPDTSESWTEGDFAGSLGVVTDDTGQGQVINIEGNDADNLYLSEALTTAVDGDISWLDGESGDGFHYYNVYKTAVTLEGQPVVAVAQHTVTSGYYFWAMRHGVGKVLVGEDAQPAGDAQGLPIRTGDDTEGTGMLVDDGNDLYDISLPYATILAGCDQADVEYLAIIHCRY